MKYIGILVVFVAIIIELITGFYVVDQCQYAIVFGFGQIQTVTLEPGLYAKWPMPIQKVLLLDNRIQTTNTVDPVSIVTADHIQLLADASIRWKIVEPQQYYIAFEGKEKVAEDSIVKAAKTILSEVVAHHTLPTILSGNDREITKAFSILLSDKLNDVGIEIVQARLERVTYTGNTAAVIYERMKSEKAKQASEIRAEGERKAKEIRAEGDRKRLIILDEAQREAARIKGQGDAEAAKIYGQAYQENPEFYKFYRSLQAYKESFNKNNRNVLVLDASSPFFKFLKRHEE